MRTFLFLIAAVFTVPIIFSCSSEDEIPDIPETGALSLQSGLAEHEQSSPELARVATLFTSILLDQEVCNEVYNAVSTALNYGLDEEYKFAEIMNPENSKITLRSSGSSLLYDRISRQLSDGLRSGSVEEADKNDLLGILSDEQLQIYWPYSEDWDGKSLPVVTFDPQNGKEWNFGYKQTLLPDGSFRTDTVIIDEDFARSHPVWVINKSNTPYEKLPAFSNNEFVANGVLYASEANNRYMERQQNELSAAGDPVYAVKIGRFKAHKNYDDLFNGGSEFVIRMGAMDKFEITSVDDLRRANPYVSMIKVNRSRKDISNKKWADVNAIMISDSKPNDIDIAFMLLEEDQGSERNWETELILKLFSKEYSIKVKLPFKSGDDMIYQTHYSRNFIFSTLNYKNGKFVEHKAPGDCFFTMEVEKGYIRNL